MYLLLLPWYIFYLKLFKSINIKSSAQFWHLPLPSSPSLAASSTPSSLPAFSLHAMSAHGWFSEELSHSEKLFNFENNILIHSADQVTTPFILSVCLADFLNAVVSLPIQATRWQLESGRISIFSDSCRGIGRSGSDPRRDTLANCIQSSFSLCRCLIQTCRQYCSIFWSKIWDPAVYLSLTKSFADVPFSHRTNTQLRMINTIVKGASVLSLMCITLNQAVVLFFGDMRAIQRWVLLVINLMIMMNTR